MEEKFIQIFSGFSENYGQADMQRLEVDPISKKQKPEYRWAQQRLTDDDYKQHLIGTNQLVFNLVMKKVNQGLVLLILTHKNTQDSI